MRVNGESPATANPRSGNVVRVSSITTNLLPAADYHHYEQRLQEVINIGMQDMKALDSAEKGDVEPTVSRGGDNNYTDRIFTEKRSGDAKV